MVRTPIAKILIAAVLALGCWSVGLGARDDRHTITASERLAAIKHAKLWEPTNIRALDLKAGPRGKGGFAPNATVTCDYAEETFAGATPKFGCAIDGEDHVKVRYGRDNNEIFAGVAATRLLWALGFGADLLYPVHVICRGCPRRISLADPKAAATGETRFDYAAIERKMKGREMEAPSVGPGWSWNELDLIDERAGGAPVAHRDALKLVAVLLQHSDNKADQQKLLCLDEDAKHLDKCASTFMMVHDVGLTFGTASLMNRATVSSVNLQGWSRTPVWKDAQHCIGNMPPSQTGTLTNPIISEAGRKFLAGLLAQLSDRQLQGLFAGARLDEKPGTDGEAGGSIADWVAAFKKKRDEIAGAHCF